MKRIKKKILALTASLLVLLSFSSCNMMFVNPGTGNVVSSESSSRSRKENSSKENDSSSSETSSQEESVMLTITEPHDVVALYIPAVKNYLEAGASADVGDYGRANNQYQGVEISWECDSDEVSRYVVEYATKADYSDAFRKTVRDQTSLEVFNLYKATVYYLRVTAYNAKGKVLAQTEGTLETTDLGPRFMKVDGIYNVRDLGGYITQDGKRTVQGLLYRGGSLTPASVYPHDLTDEGKAYMSEVMEIKTEIDFRPPSEAGGHTESPIPGANLVYITLGGYADAFGGYMQSYRQLFSTLAVKENYPIYMHCTGGADRTGTVSFILNAMLGVSELECIQDYELTSFSVYEERNTRSGPYAKYYEEFRAQLDAYAGDTLQEKAEAYLIRIGVTKAEIDSIKAIMNGEK